MIAAQERTHMLLDDLDIDWTFTTSEVKRFREMWRADASIGDIAKELDWAPLKVGLMIIDQAEKGLIEQRDNGLARGANYEKST